MVLLLDIDSAAIKVGTASLYWPADDIGSSLQRTMHNHPLASDQGTYHVAILLAKYRG